MGAGCQYERSVRVYGFATCTYVPAIRLDIGCTFVRVAITESQYSSLDSRFIYKQRLTPSTKEPSLQDIISMKVSTYMFTCKWWRDLRALLRSLALLV